MKKKNRKKFDGIFSVIKNCYMLQQHLQQQKLIFCFVFHCKSSVKYKFLPVQIHDLYLFCVWWKIVVPKDFANLFKILAGMVWISHQNWTRIKPICYTSKAYMLKWTTKKANRTWYFSFFFLLFIFDHILSSHTRFDRSFWVVFH